MIRSKRGPISSLALLISLLLVAAPALGASFRPLADRVIVEVDDEGRTKGGIIIPDTAKEKPKQGTVVAVGPGRFDDGALVPMEVRPGDRVLFSGYAGTEVPIEGGDFLIMRESDIYAVIDP